MDVLTLLLERPLTLAEVGHLADQGLLVYSPLAFGIAWLTRRLAGVVAYPWVHRFPHQGVSRLWGVGLGLGVAVITVLVVSRAGGAAPAGLDILVTLINTELAVFARVYEYRHFRRWRSRFESGSDWRAARRGEAVGLLVLVAIAGLLMSEPVRRLGLAAGTGALAGLALVSLARIRDSGGVRPILRPLGEPSTWRLMLMGLGIGGGGAWVVDPPMHAAPSVAAVGAAVAVVAITWVPLVVSAVERLQWRGRAGAVALAGSAVVLEWLRRVVHEASVGPSTWPIALGTTAILAGWLARLSPWGRDRPSRRVLWQAIGIAACLAVVWMVRLPLLRIVPTYLVAGLVTGIALIACASTRPVIKLRAGMAWASISARDAQEQMLAARRLLTTGVLAGLGVVYGVGLDRVVVSSHQGGPAAALLAPPPGGGSVWLPAAGAVLGGCLLLACDRALRQRLLSAAAGSAGLDAQVERAARRLLAVALVGGLVGAVGAWPTATPWVLGGGATVAAATHLVRSREKE